MSKLAELYEQDYTAWAHAQANLLRAGRFDALDVEHLLAELEDMGKSEQRSLESHLRVLLAHLLKWQYQYPQLAERWKEFKGDSWHNTIVQQRNETLFLLEENPGIKRFWPEVVKKAYAKARKLAADESGLPIETFPRECPYSDEQILDKAFYPQTPQR